MKFIRRMTQKSVTNTAAQTLHRCGQIATREQNDHDPLEAS